MTTLQPGDEPAWLPAVPLRARPGARNETTSLMRQLTWGGLLFLACGVGALSYRILAENQGTFIYTLDDAYIHLALARRILSGHYGINFGESASPSSSALWPFLLAPFVGQEGAWYVPLVINTLSTAGTVCIIADVLARVLGGTSLGRHRGVCSIIMLSMLMCTNPFGLIFSGMEHALQVMCACLVARGVLLESRHARFGRLTWMGLMLGPLVRYENLALSAVAVALLIAHARYAAAARLAACVAAPLLLFSGFLLSIGQTYLPASVLAKSLLAERGVLRGTWEQFVDVLTNENRGPVLAALALIFCALACVSVEREIRKIGAVSSAAVVGHLCLGRCGWFNRYEVYIYAYSVLILAPLALRVLARWSDLNRVSPAKVGALAAFGAVLVGFPYIDALRTVPLASNNIYAQQYQMRRFAAAYGRPIAVNDLGLVAYASNSYVLDLWGLASLDALEARLGLRSGGVPDRDWIGRVTAAKGVDVAMIYDEWFDGLVPPTWTKLGELRYTGELITAAEDNVSFYAMTAPAHALASARLRELARALPPNAALLLE